MNHILWKMTFALLLTAPLVANGQSAQGAPRGRGGTPASAQGAPPQAQPVPPGPSNPARGADPTFGAPSRQQVAPGSPQIPVKIQVVISRYEGDRKTSSLPYTVSTGSGTQVSLRLGTRVPVRGPTPADGKQPAPVSFVDIGTNLDATATQTEGGAFRLQLTMVESSVLDATPLLPKANLAPGHAVFGNFSYTSSLMIKDGETKQVVASTNRATGETIKLDITLTVEK